MSDIVLALLLTLAVTLLLSFIQLGSDSKILDFKAYLTGYFFLYFLIMAIGNCATTIFAVQVVKGKSMIDGVRPSFWYAFLGTFGFEALVQKINVTVFDKGVLSINDWIIKAKTSAVAATLKKSTESEIIRSQELSDQLIEKCKGNLVEIHSLAKSNLGVDDYNKIIAQYTGGVTPVESHLAFVLANEKATRIKAFLKRKH